MGLLGDAVDQMERYRLRDAIVRAGWHPYQGEGLQLQAILLADHEAGRIRSISLDLVWQAATAHGFTPDWTPLFPPKENT
jgi:hypothetical protein